MKKILYLLPTGYAMVLALFAVLALSCSNKIEPNFNVSTNEVKKISDEKTSDEKTSDELSLSGQLFNGNHNLAKIADDKYFRVSYDRYLDPTYMFIWQSKDKWEISYIEAKYFSFEVNPNISEPYIKFNWDPNNATVRTLMNDEVDNDVNYIIIVTKDNNFQELFSYGDQKRQIDTE